MMNRQKKEQYLNVALSVSMIVLLLAAFLPLIDIESPWLRYVFAFAAFVTMLVRVLQRMLYRKDKYSLRVRRLFTLEFWSSMCYLVSALFVFADPYHSTWLGFLTAGACVQVYASFMIDRQLKKEGRERIGEDVDKNA